MSFTTNIPSPSAASPAAVWRLYSDVSRWPSFDSEAERIELDGPLHRRRHGTMKFRDQEPLAFTLTEVEPENVHRRDARGGRGRTGPPSPRPHTEGVRITQRVEIDGPEAFAAELGAMITADMPATMTRLARLAEEDGTP